MIFHIAAARTARALGLMATAAVFSGCVSGKALEANTERLQQIEARLESVQASQKNQAESTAAALSSLKNQGEMAAGFTRLSDAVAVLGGRVEELNARTILLGQKLDNVKAPAEGAQEPKPEAAALEAELRAINLRLEKISERLRKGEAGTGSEPGAIQPPAVAEAATGEPSNVYRRAYEALLSGDLAAAQAGFADYLAGQPNGEFSDMAAFGLAEALAGKGDTAGARDAFDRMAEGYPASGKAPAALLRGAEMSLLLVDKTGAANRLKAVMEYYPDSQEAKKAGAMLKDTGR